MREDEVTSSPLPLDAVAAAGVPGAGSAGSVDFVGAPCDQCTDGAVD